MATQIGPKIGIEGEKEYRQQLKQIINETKNLGAAMEKTASEWTANTSQMTKNKAVAQNLVKQIDLQKEKLSVMNEMLEKSTEKFGENAEATKSWQRAIDNATASLNHMESELKEMHGAENFSSLSTKMADVGTAMQNVGQKMVGVGQRMTTSLTLPLVAAGTAAVKLASDTEEASNKVDVVFGTMSESVKQFAADALNSYGMAEGSALQMAGTFGAMATSMGLSQAQASSMSTALTALAADMASFYNVSLEVAQTSLQGIFTGETEALKKFGIVMTQTNLEAFAEQQGKVYNQMSEAEKVMTRYAFVMNAKKDKYMLRGVLKKNGYDWWWHSFTGYNKNNGEPKSFFIEYFIVNPAISPQQIVFGQKKNAPSLTEDVAPVKPSYVMIKAGVWGTDAKQIHAFYPTEKLSERQI